MGARHPLRPDALAAPPQVLVRLRGTPREPAGGSRATTDARLSAYEKSTSIQFVVVTVKSLDGQGIDRYAVEAFAAWQLGQKGQDNGLLLLIAPTERAIRFEVGYGLEGALPDGAAGEIIRTITPDLSAGRYDAAVTAAVELAITKIDATPVAARTGTSRNTTSSFGWGWVVLIILVIVLVEGMGLATGNPFLIFYLVQLMLELASSSGGKDSDSGFSGGGGRSGGGGASGSF